MARVRLWQHADLPILQQWIITLNQSITPADDQAITSPETIGRLAVANLHSVLSSQYGTAFVAEESGRPVGFILLAVQHNDRTGEPRGYVADVYIEPGARRGGTMGLLCGLADEYFRRLGLRQITAWVHAHNSQALRAFGKVGMRPMGVVMAKQLKKVAQK